MLDPKLKIALFMEESLGEMYGKMGYGVLRYSPNPVVCVIDSRHQGKRVSDVVGTPRDCPVVGSVDAAIALGAEVLVLGIAPSGGLLPEAWIHHIDEAIEKGLSLVNGLHETFGERYPDLRPGQIVWDVRLEPVGLQPGTGAAAALGNLRVLLVGTDMALGKMTTGLELWKLARDQGFRADFVATGQIGITVTGRGVPLDAVRVDFACGAVEREVLACKDAEIVFIEGQGSLVHPGSTSNLPLLRGSMPTHLVLCHRAHQKTLTRLTHIPLPSLEKLIKLYEDLSECGGVFPRAKVIGVSLNTAELDSDQAASEACDQIESELGIPCVDPIRHGRQGQQRILDAIVAPRG